MVHRKEKHKEVKNCLYYSIGTCVFSDEVCWYQHNPTSLTADIITEYKCSMCEKIFLFKPGFMKHRKNYHPDSISVCEKYENDNCHFGINMQRKILTLMTG